ncbi:hypothetical protein BGZ49_006808 [Haplosporangium sp. Z 27]|nr:hypothetical protein BGZ49_006808 [Haplosporangium sp. Z 27]
MAWWGWLLYKSRSTSNGIDNEVSEEAQTPDVLISMPHERAFPETTEISGGVSRGSVGPSVALSESNSDDNMEKYQPKNKEYVPPPSEKSLQHTAMVPMNPQNSPFGLGIDIYTKNATAMVASNSENEDARINNSGPGTAIPNSANHSKATLEDINRTQGSLNKLHRDNTSFSGINAAALSRTPARSRSNSTTSNQSTSNITGRLRDYAKVFSMPRSTASSIHEAYSDRGTPVMHSASREFAPGSAQPFRGGMGYMGAHTMKALNNFPRSVSMGNVAAQNNATAGSSTTPDRASPVVGDMMPGGLESSQTPVKSKSQSMSNIFGTSPSEGYYPQTPAEAEASEQSMDEHLRAIRRRSAAAEAMNIQCNNNENPIFAADMVASPAPSSRASSFRMSFSSPSLSPYRRRSSLGLKSALNSIVPLSAKSGSSSGSSSVSSSEASSPCLPSPRESISNNSVGGRSSLEAYSKQQQTVSANELLLAEYGDMYSSRPGAEQTFGDHDQASIVGRGTLRPRSNSVSSNSTTKTVSSGVSDSASSITSNLTSLSTEERRAARAAGPPQAFFNRIKVGHHRKGSQQYHKKQHHHIQGRGSNSSKKEIAAMIPAHSSQSENGSPSQLSWDNRSDMPIN